MHNRDFLCEDIVLKSLSTKDRRILDFGCGDCEFFDNLNDMGRLVGCDINKEKLNKAKKRGYEVYSSLDKIKGKFDFVILCEVIEHLSLEEAKFFLKKIQLFLMLIIGRKPFLKHRRVRPRPGCF